MPLSLELNARALGGYLFIAMTKAERQTKADLNFYSSVTEMARRAGAAIIPSTLGNGLEEFVFQTPLGELRGGAIGELIYMRFTNPGSGKPGIRLHDFNPHSRKWNIQGYESGEGCQAAALLEFAHRIEWITSVPVSA